MNGTAPIPYRRIGGIDPGLATGAMVIIDRARRERVIGAFSLVESSAAVAHAKEQAKELAAALGGWPDLDMLRADLRARAQVARLCEVLDLFEAEHGIVEVFALESFDDQHQHAKKMMRNRWMTPLVIGYLGAALEQRGVNATNGRLVFQNAGVVLKQFADERSRLKARAKPDRDIIVPGDRQVTNDHLRSALSHGLALSQRLPAVHLASSETAAVAAV